MTPARLAAIRAEVALLRGGSLSAPDAAARLAGFVDELGAGLDWLWCDTIAAQERIAEVTRERDATRAALRGLILSHDWGQRDLPCWCDQGAFDHTKECEAARAALGEGT